MDVKHTLSGWVSVGDRENENESLFVKDRLSDGDIYGTSISTWFINNIGKCGVVTIRWSLTDTELTPEEVTEYMVLSMFGHTTADHNVKWSDITGYLWTTDTLKIGGHDLIEIFKGDQGKWLNLEVIHHTDKTVFQDAAYTKRLPFPSLEQSPEVDKRVTFGTPLFDETSGRTLVDVMIEGGVNTGVCYTRMLVNGLFNRVSNANFDPFKYKDPAALFQAIVKEAGIMISEKDIDIEIISDDKIIITGKEGSLLFVPGSSIELCRG